LGFDPPIFSHACSLVAILSICKGKLGVASWRGLFSADTRIARNLFADKKF
jgi:hypothetical protein